MGDKEFIKNAKAALINYKNNIITEDEIFVVWLCKTLQNNKALLSTTVSDEMYYEITFNGDKKELYLDAYKKWENKVYHTDEKEKR